jgi:hypothetical protein
MYQTASALRRNAEGAVLSLLLCVGVTGEAAAAIPASERDALIALYNATNGAGWTVRTSRRDAAGKDFNSPGTECTWYGVVCGAGGGYVERLLLQANSLAGAIPTEIGSLTLAAVLYLGGNQLSGPIPQEIGGLTSLSADWLDLRWNAFYTNDAALVS